ncbi:MAG: hypothetical protein U0R19_06870 [Bryobacteraceae bacterium]
MPTGTLANHLAVRLLAGERRACWCKRSRICVERLRRLRADAERDQHGGLAPGKATFRLTKWKRWWDAARGSRVALIGAIQD